MPRKRKSTKASNTSEVTAKQPKMAFRRAVTTTKAPGAIAPYSQAMWAGNTLYCSGQLGMTAEGVIESDCPAHQTKQALTNVGILLKEAGLDYCDVVKTTVLMSNIDDYPAINAEYAKFFPDPKPARSAFAVAALPKHPESKVEIEVIAAKE